jgi:NDP-sugar pyrophosphorylase family protein
MWYELSTLQRYLEISLALLKQRGLDLYTGENPTIDQQAEVGEAILWNGVTIEAGARVRRAVLGDGVRVRTGERVDDAVVVRADLVAALTPPAKALQGYVSGGNFVVPLSQ